MNCVVMHFKGFSEIGACILRSDLAMSDIRMTRAIIYGKDVMHGHLPCVVRVEFVECLLDEFITILVQSADQHIEEFTVLNFTVVIHVKAFEQVFRVLRVHIDFVIFERFLELEEVECPVVVGVEYLELAAQSDESSASTVLELLLESFDQD